MQGDQQQAGRPSRRSAQIARDKIAQMEDPANSYAPRSPDLSGLVAPPDYADPAAAAAASSHSQMPSYSQHPQPIRQDSFSLPQSSYYQPPPLALQQQQQQQIASSPYSYLPQQIAYAPPPPSFQHHYTMPGMKGEEDDGAWLHHMDQGQRHGSAGSRTPGSSRKPQLKSSVSQPPLSQPLPPMEPRQPAPGEEEGIVVKTKFPVARIKRIVQADEEVGKVAQVTPVAVGKALELFMIHITLSSAALATSRNSKRLTAAHIKATIQQNAQFDFLHEIAAKIPDGPAGRGEKKGAKAAPSDEEDLVDDEDGTYGEGSASRSKAAKGRGGARRKREKDEDDW